MPGIIGPDSRMGVEQLSRVMSVESLQSIADRVAKSGQIEATDVAAARRASYGDDGAISVGEAEAIYAIERARTHASVEWTTFLVEAITDFMLQQQPPAGYLSEENAAWLEGQIGMRKLPSTDGDVALVAQLIETARDVPSSFSAFALRLVKDAVIYMDGPDAAGRMHAGGKITEADTALLSRILWGAGKEGHLAISREEAEALFDIADATTGADNTEGFEDLFARAVGNYLIGATGRDVPSREDALRWQTDDAYKASVLSFLSRVVASVPDGFDGAFIKDTLKNMGTLGEDVEYRILGENEARETATMLAEIMTPEKAGWLLERVHRNGVFTPAERALVHFVRREAAALDPSLAALPA